MIHYPLQNDAPIGVITNMPFNSLDH